MLHCITILITSLLTVAHYTLAAPVDIMPATKVQHYQSLMPSVSDPEINQILKSPDTLWYDAESMVPVYQDSMGDPEGNRPNTIAKILIDTAVPGGWARLFSRSGRFNFPFATGGADLCDNLHKINFWAPPKESGRILPVVYWVLEFSRWQWLFPKGTIIGEVLLVNFTGGEQRIFEIRTRTREIDKWVNNIYRPFTNPNELADSIRAERPDWISSPSLRKLVFHLTESSLLTPRTLQTTHFKGAFDTVAGHLDHLPNFADPELAKSLLNKTTFRPTRGLEWKRDGSAVTYAPSTQFPDSIVPRLYDGGMLPVDDISCRRCHKDGGRQIGNFHDDLVAYGELWGEDEIFSWHPYQNSTFVNANGEVVNFNNDNRRLRQDLVTSGLVAKFNSGSHPTSFYKALPRDWKYNPFER